MLPTLLVIIAVTIMIALWLMITQRKLVILDENTNNAMSQIGVQLSSRFDALMSILDITRIYAAIESKHLIDYIKNHRSVITAKTIPIDVIRQEYIISEALSKINMLSEHYPDLVSNLSYLKAMAAVQTYENMVRTSKLIYNDSAAKLNRIIRKFPVSMVSGMLGFTQRDYLEDQKLNADLQMK